MLFSRHSFISLWEELWDMTSRKADRGKNFGQIGQFVAWVFLWIQLYQHVLSTTDSSRVQIVSISVSPWQELGVSLSDVEHAYGAHDLCFDFDDFCTSSWLSWRWEERGQISNSRYSYYISLVFLITGTGRFGLLKWLVWSRCCAPTLHVASAVPQGSGSSLCNCRLLRTMCACCSVDLLTAQASQWPFRQAIYSVLLLFWTSVFPFQRKLKEKEIPWEMAAMSVFFSVPVHLPCSSPWSGGSFLINGRTGWITDCREQKCQPLSSMFPLPASHIMGDYPRLYHLRHAVLAIGEVYHWFSSFFKTWGTGLSIWFTIKWQILQYIPRTPGVISHLSCIFNRLL